MKVSVTTIPVEELDVNLLVALVGVANRESQLNTLAKAFGDNVTQAGKDLAEGQGENVLLYPQGGRAERLMLISLGEEDKLTAEGLRICGDKAAKVALAKKTETVSCVLPAFEGIDTETAAQAWVEGFSLGSYRFLRYKKEEEGHFDGIERLVMQAGDQEKACRVGAERGRIIAEAVLTARDLINAAPHDTTATLLAKSAEKLAKKHGFTASVWDKALIEDEKMGGLLAVNRGSVEPPTFTIMEWQPENPVNERPLVLVGKGVVFDTGGLSLKPTKSSMDYMKADMSGAAAVIGTMEAVARLELPLHIIGLVPATDNRPGVDAYVPGEVVNMHSGLTVEVLNTDAEGRMLLADALSYAQNYKPELVIDIATLTGAAVIALGKEVGAIMTNEREGADERIAAMMKASRASGDLVHPLPMFDSYTKQLKSEVADIKNVGGREAGTITAGKFLEHFVDYPWIHVDIAGPAFLHEPKPYRPKGGTGFGVRLFTAFLREYASLKRNS